MKIVIDRDIPFLFGVFEPFAETIYLRGDEVVASDVSDADALIVRTRTLCNASLLEGSRVRFIATATIGIDHIDTAWCASHGITVASAAGCNARGVLQWAAAALAYPVGHEGRKPSETTLGIVGVGNVGSLVKQYAESWGFRTMCSDPPRERTEGLGVREGFYPLSEIVAGSDIITLHTPLTAMGPDATRHMVGRDFLAAMKPGAVVLNSSRGAVIDPEALREAVEAGRREFVIDTWNGEPYIDRRVLERILLATPHIAGYTVQGKATATAMVVNALAREFGIDRLRDWYPEGVSRSEARAISWDEMCRTMPSCFDIAAISAALKASPERFEQMRDGYRYREEYF